MSYYDPNYDEYDDNFQAYVDQECEGMGQGCICWHCQSERHRVEMEGWG